jgi:excinuclease UvrABC nuclease subunit
LKDFSHLKTAISLLPGQPGVYKYRDESNTIIYVGKAKNLKKRVSSYFNKEHDNTLQDLTKLYNTLQSKSSTLQSFREP